MDSVAKIFAMVFMVLAAFTTTLLCISSIISPAPMYFHLQFLETVFWGGIALLSYRWVWRNTL